MDTIFGGRHCIAPGESVSRAYAVGMQMAKNHKEDFKAVAKDVLGLQTTNIIGTIECEAMIQDSNMSFNQFSIIKRLVFHATDGSFKMRYRQNE
jgi:predicted nucleotidyltransferase